MYQKINFWWWSELNKLWIVIKLSGKNKDLSNNKGVIHDISRTLILCNLLISADDGEDLNYKENLACVFLVVVDSSKTSACYIQASSMKYTELHN